MAKLLVLTLLAIAIAQLFAGSNAAPAANVRAKRFLVARQGDFDQDGLVETQVARNPRALLDLNLGQPLFAPRAAAFAFGSPFAASNAFMFDSFGNAMMANDFATNSNAFMFASPQFREGLIRLNL